MRFSLVTAAFLLVLSGCGPKKSKHSVTLWLPEPIAILPLNNFSTDLQGPIVTRYLMHRRFSASLGLLDIEEVDEKLKGIGITDGGQLKAVTPNELGETLKAHGLLYGELEEFKNMNLGVYHKRSVKLHLWLVNAKTGEKLWEGSKKVANSKVATTKEEAAVNLFEGYTEKVIEMMSKHPLKEETDLAVQFVAYDLESKFGRTMFPKPTEKKRGGDNNSSGLIQKGIKKWGKLGGKQ